MDLNRNSFAIIPNFNNITLWIDSHLYHVLSFIILVVVCRIYQDLIYTLIVNNLAKIYGDQF